ncbi:MAG: glycosyltransferase family 2 protein [Colwellia sp.]
MNDKVYVVVLNYKNSTDTLVCLESLLSLSYDNFEIILVDNFSNDGSLEVIGNVISSLSLDGSVNSSRYDSHLELLEKSGKNGRSINVVLSESNKGFAGGNNLGISLALSRSDADYICVLNTDTLVSPDALSCLLERAEFYKIKKKKVGIIGSKLKYLENPDTLQGIGGVYNKLWGTSNHVGDGEVDSGQYDFEGAFENVDYPIGASMFVSTSFIADVGLMAEYYFLYFEELDWANRGREKDWSIGYCWEGDIYHKCGGTIGSSNDWREKSAVSDYYCLRNRALITYTHYPLYLGTVSLGYGVALINRVRRGQFKRLLDYGRWLIRDVKLWLS